MWDKETTKIPEVIPLNQVSERIKQGLMAAARRTFLDLIGPSRPYNNHLEKCTRQERGGAAGPVGLEVVQKSISNPLLVPPLTPFLPKEISTHPGSLV